MGCSKSKGGGGGSGAAAQTGGGYKPIKGGEKKEYSWEKKKQGLDPKDFIISKREGEAVTKAAGSIDGQQFIIEECRNCDIFLCDFMATISIDHCENSRFFVGPVETSIFVRNCKNCEFIIACQQFRSRDCENCRFALFCMTEPIIETSKKMQFACFDFFYFTMKEQFRRAGLKIWNNKWWQIHDFNKNLQDPNWGLFPQEDVAGLLRSSQCTGLDDGEQAMDKVVPVTLGPRTRPSQEACFVVFMPNSEVVIEGFLTKAKEHSNWALCRTRATILDEGRAKQLFAWCKDGAAKQCVGQEVVGIELCGAGILQQVSEAIATSGLASQAKSMRVVPEKDTPGLAQAFFETWKDEI
eukprot:TRINITY_DN38161_c0_g1_i1.p2 TRINITY_DN38161_c0_g1~~TRINITY_DN38161_c0_g1_i1.p2  ORF type:complete len:354 (+),score=94.19 TRINITY_DN38161_c0_g1_i1:369-1430(+)